MTKISVVMPIYNAEEFLNESIGDILAQTFEEFELICVDDGSTDGSTKILKKLQQQDDRIKVLNQTNAGAGAARNKGLAIAQGKYLLFLDADDRFEKSMLSEIWSQAEETMADIVVFGADCFQYGTGRKRAANWLLDKKYLTDEYIEEGIIKREKKREVLYSVSNSTVWNKLFRTDFIRNNKIMFQEIHVVVSMYFVMLAMAYAERITTYDKVLVHYRENVPTGQMMNHDKSPTGVYEALCAVKENLEQSKHFKGVEKAFVRYAVKCCLDRLACLTSCKAEMELYNILHNGGFEKLGLNVEINNSEVPNEQWEKCRSIYSTDYIEYLYYKKNVLQNMINRAGFIYPLKNELLLTKKKVAIYGAGNVGKSYAIQLMNDNGHKFVGWFDKNYISYGYPVENPQLLPDREADAVLIAVQMDTVANEIKKDLISLGVEEEKIIWAEPQIL